MYPSWHERNIDCVLYIFNSKGNILTYEQFITLKEFPIPFREFISVIKAIPSGLTTIMKTHLSFGNDHKVYPELRLEGVGLLERSCCNKYIRQILHSQNQLTQSGKFFWNMLILDVVWKNAWLRPYKYCIPNKVKEVKFYIRYIHVILWYPNLWLLMISVFSVKKKVRICLTCSLNVNLCHNFGKTLQNTYLSLWTLPMFLTWNI